LSGKGGILEKLGLQAIAPSRRGIRFEGLKFAMGDFILSCAQATGLGGGKQFLGVVLEVEYLPLLNSTVASPVLDVSSYNQLTSVCSYVCHSMLLRRVHYVATYRLEAELKLCQECSLISK
jgi:hypothetical protein